MSGQLDTEKVEGVLREPKDIVVRGKYSTQPDVQEFLQILLSMQRHFGVRAGELATPDAFEAAIEDREQPS